MQTGFKQHCSKKKKVTLDTHNSGRVTLHRVSVGLLPITVFTANKKKQQQQKKSDLWSGPLLPSCGHRTWQQVLLLSLFCSFKPQTSSSALLKFLTWHKKQRHFFPPMKYINKQYITINNFCSLNTTSRGVCACALCLQVNSKNDYHEAFMWHWIQTDHGSHSSPPARQRITSLLSPQPKKESLKIWREKIKPNKLK